jgi:type IV secretory pathway TrbD component
MARGSPIFRCLTQPLLVAGAERTPAIVVAGSAIFCAVAAWFTWSVAAAVMAALLFLVGLPTLRIMANRDPRMIEILLRYVGYRRHYAAHTPRALPPSGLTIIGLAILAILMGLALAAMAWMAWFFIAVLG